ncbi:MAG: SDR family NAD(P)-dependent oxidoreductase, partial [Gemmatimonadaceae bacterium]|nr:SDR family NAD(P)-dependent oxidoreductase [Chitinophagaceae bacterium]
MDLKLRDKVFVVSGGAKGIGEGIVRVLAAEGATVVLIGRNETDNKRLADELVQQGWAVDFVTAELSDPSGCDAAVKDILKKYPLVHGLVNNAG